MEKKDNIINRVQNYLDTEKGRILLNYLYSWGAAIVILGALFKLTHISGANLMLFLGMGTEVFVFFISGFERPFIPDDNRDTEEDDCAVTSAGHASAPSADARPANIQDAAAISAGGVCTQQFPENLGALLSVEGVSGVTQDYINQLQELTSKLNKVAEQSDLLERSTEEIDTLGRNLVSLNTFYEMHLRSVSSQMDNIDKVKDQTAEMVRQIEELNKAYARMVEALKVNSGADSSAK